MSCAKQDETLSRCGTIAAVRAVPVNIPREAPYLSSVGAVHGISKTIVDVESSDGVVGLGEAASPRRAVDDLYAV